MTEKLLSISDAAELLGVCENTLRDWDIENKFKATRTPGGHRRYTLEQIQTYLKKHPKKMIENDSSFNQSEELNNKNRIDFLLEKWEKTEFLADIPLTRQERSVLAVLLENVKDQVKITVDKSLSTNQSLWLTKHAWLRSKFRKMVSVQPMIGPASLVYFAKDAVLHSDAVAALAHNSNFNIFVNADFETVKDLYANAIAEWIDTDIVKNLHKVDLEDITIAKPNLSECYDYLIGPDGITETLRKDNVPGIDNIDIFEIMPILDPKTYIPIVVAGKYPEHNFVLPIYCPYILFQESPRVYSCVRKVIHRTSWYPKND